MAEPQARPVGVFDSGLGGLTVLREIMKELPNESVLYFGDTARFPYGPRAPEELQGFVLEIVSFLVARDVKIIVSACNSSSAVALGAVQERFQLGLLGVIEPGVRAALRTSRSRRLGVIGTPATIKSDTYARALERLDPDAVLFSRQTPELADFVERGETSGPILRARLESYLTPLLAADIDSLILGCTHYPLLADAIQEVVGDRVAVISSAAETARELRRNLEVTGLLSSQKGAEYHYYSTGEIRSFFLTGQRFLGQSIGQVHRIPTEQIAPSLPLSD